MAMCLSLLSVSFALILILSCWFEVVQKTGLIAIVIATAYLVRYVYTTYTYLLTCIVYLRASVTALATLPTTLQNGISDGYHMITATESGTTHMRCKLYQNANQFVQLANHQLMIHAQFISNAIPSPYVSQMVDDSVLLVTHVWKLIQAFMIHNGKTCARQLLHLVQGLNGGTIESTGNLRLEGNAAKKGAVVVSVSRMDSLEYAEPVLRALHAAKVVRDMFEFKTQETQEVDWVIVDPEDAAK